jgi:hypothetical protein
MFQHKNVVGKKKKKKVKKKTINTAIGELEEAGIKK